MTVNGIDISHWQPASTDDVNMDGCEFVGIRACYGNVKDHLYDAHEANARKHGAYVLAYCFGIPGQPWKAQADALLAAAPNADLYVLDRERDGNRGTMTSSDARAFIAYVASKTPKRVGLYSSESQFRDLGQEFDWVANWSRKPVWHWEFWQTRGAPLDLDVFNGDLDALKKLCGVVPVVPPVVPPIPKPKPKPKPPVKAYHTVKAGDNLTSIAHSHKTTLGQLLAYPENAKYRSNPGLIHVGDRVRVR
jgi:GH25 family lysozyme M1 (1,4-beta-N-acetylmuramidase)